MGRMDDWKNGKCTLDKEQTETILDTFESLFLKNLEEASMYIGCSKSSFYRLISIGVIPKGRHHIGKYGVGWTLEDLAEGKKYWNMYHPK